MGTCCRIIAASDKATRWPHCAEFVAWKVRLASTAAVANIFSRGLPQLFPTWHFTELCWAITADMLLPFRTQPGTPLFSKKFSIEEALHEAARFQRSNDERRAFEKRLNTPGTPPMQRSVFWRQTEWLAHSSLTAPRTEVHAKERDSVLVLVIAIAKSCSPNETAKCDHRQNPSDYREWRLPPGTRAALYSTGTSDSTCQKTLIRGSVNRHLARAYSGATVLHLALCCYKFSL